MSLTVNSNYCPVKPTLFTVVLIDLVRRWFHSHKYQDISLHFDGKSASSPNSESRYSVRATNRRWWRKNKKYILCFIDIIQHDDKTVKNVNLKCYGHPYVFTNIIKTLKDDFFSATPIEVTYLADQPYLSE